MKKKVVILGGGVAGMSAAHELIERGYKVEIFEKNPEYVGGKARSINYYGDNNSYEIPLPGEHGFRFFPGFYKHVTNTMQRTPFGDDKTCYDNLVASKTAMMASFGKPELLTLVNFPKSISDLETMLDSFVEASKITDLQPGDSKFFASKLWELATSSIERRADQLEKVSWMDFTEGMKRSPAYRQYFVAGLTRTLVAAKANEVSTKTGGNTLLQLIFLMLNPKSHADRVLNKPTNEAWLYPWRDYLLSNGVVYNHACITKRIHLENNKITKVTIQKQDGIEEIVEADYFICAMPVERMNELLFPELLAAAPSLSGIPKLAGDVSWMTGIQFFLNKDIKLNFGHTIYTNSPWALTSISQPQFWTNYSLEGRGNGNVKGILSIDISDWFTAGLNGKYASQCETKEEIMEEVWHELELSLNTNGETIISKDMIEDYYMDRDIIIRGNMKTSNEEPLLVNKINTWQLRPKAETEIPNLLLASDYVQTYTDLATMEGANEAARRAVNSILQKDNYLGEKCGVWKLKEPDLLLIHRWYDKKRYQKGLPWYGPKLPFPYILINFTYSLYLIVRDFIKNLF